MGVRRKYWALDSVQEVLTDISNTLLLFSAYMSWLISSTHLTGTVVISCRASVYLYRAVNSVHAPLPA